jgi:hypothetical protein
VKLVYQYSIDAPFDDLSLPDYPVWMTRVRNATRDNQIRLFSSQLHYGWYDFQHDMTPISAPPEPWYGTVEDLDQIAVVPYRELTIYPGVSSPALAVIRSTEYVPGQEYTDRNTTPLATAGRRIVFGQTPPAAGDVYYYDATLPAATNQRGTYWVGSNLAYLINVYQCELTPPTISIVAQYGQQRQTARIHFDGPYETGATMAYKTEFHFERGLVITSEWASYTGDFEVTLPLTGVYCRVLGRCDRPGGWLSSTPSAVSFALDAAPPPPPPAESAELTQQHAAVYDVASDTLHQVYPVNGTLYYRYACPARGAWRAPVAIGAGSRPGLVLTGHGLQVTYEDSARNIVQRETEGDGIWRTLS